MRNYREASLRRDAVQGRAILLRGVSAAVPNLHRHDVRLSARGNLRGNEQHNPVVRSLPTLASRRERIVVGEHQVVQPGLLARAEDLLDRPGPVAVA